MTRLQLILMPHRREYVCWPHRDPPLRVPALISPKGHPSSGVPPSTHRRKPRAVRVNFNCRHHARDCLGCATVDDDRLARWRRGNYFAYPPSMYTVAASTSPGVGPAC
jgi:hypothetical protein